jgi:hypothetical protein
MVEITLTAPMVTTAYVPSKVVTWSRIPTDTVVNIIDKTIEIAFTKKHVSGTKNHPSMIELRE